MPSFQILAYIQYLLFLKLYLFIIFRHHRDILTDKDCEHVYELVYSSHRAVAQAAGEFLNERLFVPEDVPLQRTNRGKKRLPNTPLIRDLAQFFIESEVGSSKTEFLCVFF